MNVIQLNKFVKLHDGEKIFFCKFDFLKQAINDVSKLKHNVVLIVAGSDMCLYNQHVNLFPKNVQKVFSWNCCVDESKRGTLIQPIPRGIEVSEPVKYGPYSWCGYEVEGNEKRKILSNPPTKTPDKFIYANFRVNTNPHHRTIVREVAINSPFMTWQEPPGKTDRERYNQGVSYLEFVNGILEHEAVLCAQGNDNGDNLRVYETLYLDRVPLTFNPKMYESIHHHFSVALISDMSDLYSQDKLRKKIDSAKKKKNNNLKYLDFDYWKDMIFDEVKKI